MPDRTLDIITGVVEISLMTLAGLALVVVLFTSALQ